MADDTPDETTPEKDLPFRPPLPPRQPKKRKQRFPLVKAIVDSLAEMSLKPLLNYVRREWKAVKKYPGFLALCVLIAGWATWYATKWWYIALPYRGETKMHLFFPGDGTEPQTITRANIYRAFTMALETQFTGPKNEKEVTVAKSRVWIVGLIFDKEIDAENMLLSAHGLNPDTRLEIRDFTGRSATVFIEPKNVINPDEPNNPANPKGILEIEAIKRVVTSPQQPVRPSPPSVKSEPAPISPSDSSTLTPTPSSSPVRN